MKINIVGCGLSGVIAALLLKKNHNVTIFETRSHIGGNCYDSNISGTLVHNYGPHIFHTNSDEVFNLLSEHTEWFPFRHQPKGNTKLGLISLPYSKKTIKEIGRELTQEEIVEYIFKEYSEKQWGIPFNQIPSEITNRIPKTANCEDPTWFEGQKHQYMPKYGYTKMFESMLKDVQVNLSCDINDWKKESSDLTIFTGKIDEYFNYKFGKLPYRSLFFKHKVSDEKLDVFLINENTLSVPYTRRYDHRFLTINHKGVTVITEEYPCDYTDNIPFYPIPFGQGASMYSLYEQLAKKENKTIFLGRLAKYKYLDMEKAVDEVINTLKTFL